MSEDVVVDRKRYEAGYSSEDVYRREPVSGNVDRGEVRDVEREKGREGGDVVGPDGERVDTHGKELDWDGSSKLVPIDVPRGEQKRGRVELATTAGERKR